MSHITAKVANKAIRETPGTLTEQEDAIRAAFNLPKDTALQQMPATIREAFNEAYRRNVMEKRRQEKKLRHRPIGRKGSHGRRLIFEFEGSKREVHFHATKGRRTYRKKGK